MNILVLCPLLFKSSKATDDQIFSDINEVYLAGKFDAVLLFVSEQRCNLPNFQFAKLFEKKINSKNAIEEILDSIENFNFSETFEYFFCLVHSDSDICHEIYKTSKARNKICFMSLIDQDEKSEFIPIDLGEEETAGQKFLANELSKYHAKNKTYRRYVRFHSLK